MVADERPVMVRRTCDQAGHPAWFSVGITECPVCTGHKNVDTAEEREKVREAWQFRGGCANPIAAEYGFGRFASTYVGAR